MPARYILEDGHEGVRGIIITSATPRSQLLLSVNINDTSVIGITCEGLVNIDGTVTESEATLSITIYGE